MIQQILSLIVAQLNSYIRSLSNNQTDHFVVAGNIGLATIFGGHEEYMNEKIVVSAVNIMEEPTLKNSSPYRPASLNPEMENPPVYINLFLLFTANFNTAVGDATPNGQSYYNGITRLSQVIEFFQGKSSITIQNSPMADLLPETLDADERLPDLQDVCIDMELVSLTFEQVNYLWGSLGGKQVPFALYKAHVIPVKRSNLLGRGALVQDIQSSSLHFSNSDS